MARTICDWVPSVEKVRMCNSGTEATMSAIRLARGFTKRDYIVKFDGCYHGHSDSLLVAAGSGALTHGEPDSAGVPKAFAEKTIVLPYNDPEALEALFAARGEEIAAIIVESYPANAGLVFPKPGYLDLLSSITKKHGALLIFDEVMTGFRLGKAGVQGLENLTPDLSCFGKVIGGGLPVGAFGGRADVMDMLAPIGPVYQAGTLSGNPLAMAAGLAQLRELDKRSGFGRLEQLGAHFEAGLRAASRGKGRAAPLQPRRLDVLPVLHRPRNRQRRRRDEAGPGVLQKVLLGLPRQRASTSRPRPTKPASSRSPTPRRIWTTRSRCSARCWRRSEE